MNKILVILGPTATGKSDLAVKLALKYNGEIIYADSRQVYVGLNINTGKIIKKLDKNRAKNIDTKNHVRLIRAIEIAKYLGSVPKLKKNNNKNAYEFIQIGLTLSNIELKTKIHKRLMARLRCGMIREVINLHKNGLSWKRMRGMGLEYRYLADYVKQKLTKVQ